MSEKEIIQSTKQWLDTVVVGFNLCPFADRELTKGSVRFVVTEATSESALLEALKFELVILNDDTRIETTLLIHPNVLGEFPDYNQFLNDAEQLLLEQNLEGVYQIASFHPGYQFSGTDSNDAENYTNRSPYPMLHILREQSVERAITDFADIDQVPERNIETMNAIGRDTLQSILSSCHDEVENGSN